MKTRNPVYVLGCGHKISCGCGHPVGALVHCLACGHNQRITAKEEAK